MLKESNPADFPDCSRALALVLSELPLRGTRLRDVNLGTPPRNEQSDPGGLLYRYWAKAGSDAEPRIHLAIWHALDVAAVTMELLARNPLVASSFSRWLSMSLGDATRFVAAAIGLHDLGKMSGAFQAKRPDAARLLGATIDPRLWTSNSHHADLTVPLYDVIVGTTIHTLTDVFRQLLVAISGHHGRPAATIQGVSPGAPNIAAALNGARIAGPQDVAAAAELRRIVVELVAPSILPIARELEPACTWATAGLAVLADWIGSNERWFEPRTEALGPTEYWERARASAQTAVIDSGVGAVLPSSLAGLETWVQDCAPRPMQRMGADVALHSGDTITIIEDLTGSGKTEAALILAHRLIATGRAQRLFWALPTQGMHRGIR